MAKKQELADFKALVREATAGSGCRRLEQGESVVVHFVYEFTNSDGWRRLYRYFDEKEQRSVYLTDSEDAPEGVSCSGSFFGVGWDVKEKRLDVWELRKSLAKELIEFEEEHGSIIDRPYKLQRRGEGKKTRYRALPQEPAGLSKKTKKAVANSADMLSEVLDVLLSYD